MSMPRKIVKEEVLSTPEVKEILGSIEEERLDQFQRRTLDYASKFSKVKPEKAEFLLRELVKKFELEESEAVEIVNCMPESIEELRVFLAGGRRIIETSKLEAILQFLNENREPEDTA